MQEPGGFNSDEYWFEISGEPRFLKSRSRASQIRDPVLRILLKMLNYSFTHRSTGHDKMYSEDLWLLWSIHRGHPSHYINLPWVLCQYMIKRARGTQADSKICCGHFVTRIAKHFRLNTGTHLRECSAGVDTKLIGRRDLDLAHLIDRNTGGLIGVGEVPPPQGARQRPPRGRRTSFEHRVMMRILYIMERYQASWEHAAQIHAQLIGEQIGPYAPPGLDSDTDAGDDGDAGGDDEQENVDEDEGDADMDDD